MEIVIIWILFGVAASIAAGAKGRSGCGWFVMGILLGPFSLLFVLLLPSSTQESSPPLPTEPTKRCPHCSETIKLAAVKCRYCGEPVDYGKL